MRVKLFIACLVVVATFSREPLMAQVAPPSPLQTGSVTGVVRTAAGTPASGVRVTAMRADSMDDALRAMVSLTQTDSTGRYRLENIPPGRYYIAAGRVDLPTYYPGTLEVAKGAAVSITSAAPLSDIDFVIQNTSAAVPPARGTLRFNFNLGRTFGPTPGANPLLPPAALPQIGLLPISPSQAPLAPNGRFRVGMNLGTIAAQPSAAWWTNVALVSRLGLTADQMKKVEATFDQNRQAIVQDTADLAKEEAALARLLEADPMEPAKTISAQIERVIQARGELERTNSKMTLEMRQNLTRAQWVQLQMETQRPAISSLPVLQFRTVRPAPNAPK